jgi:hypothetical protein
MGTSLLDVGICSVPERENSSSAFVYQRRCEEVLSLSILLKETNESSYQHHGLTVEVSPTQSAVFVPCCSVGL